MRKKFLFAIAIVLAMIVLVAQSGLADIICESLDANPDPQLDSQYSQNMVSTALPAPISQTLPDGYMGLPTFPLLWWSGGCGPTSAAMAAGYFDNSGFPNMCRKKTGPNTYVDYVFPTGGYPNDNQIFLVSGDAPNRYISRCDVAASQAGSFDRSDYGNIDDYWYNWNNWEATLGAGSGSDPYLTFGRTAHPNDCIGDFAGASIYSYRYCANGGVNAFYDSTGPALRWVPGTYDVALKEFTNIDRPTCEQFPHRSAVDLMYGFGQYVATFAGYHTSTPSHATDGTAFDDVAYYSSRYIKGLRMYGFGPLAQGATQQDVINELEAGYPVLLNVVGVSEKNDSTGTVANKGALHVMVAWGYNQAEIAADSSAQLQMVCYDTWNEYDLSSEFLPTTYRIVPFPTVAQAGELYFHDFQRKSKGDQWSKVYAVGFFRVTNHDRCPDSLAPSNVPSGCYNDPFDLTLNLGSDVYHVHYDYGKDPNPDSPVLTLDSAGQATMHIDRDMALFFRTYRDVALPDGYLASGSTRRFYSVFSENKNIKKCNDGDFVTTINGIVTAVSDSDHFYFEERDKRLFGIRVLKSNHGVNVGDEIQVVCGTLKTDAAGTSTDEPETLDNYERYIQATEVIKLSQPSTQIKPLGMTNKLVGGGSYNPPQPPGTTGTGHGQLGVTGSIGLNNVGVLVRVYGKVTSLDGDFMTISDGSGVHDLNGNLGVRVYAPYMIPETLVANQSIVAVTGVCSLETGGTSGTDLFPVVRVRTTDDISIYIP